MLCEQIKSLRIARQWTQVQLASKLNVSKQSVCNWENDNILPSVEMLEKIADQFSCSVDYLLGRNSQQYIEVSGLTPEQVAHIQMIIEDIRK